MVCKDYVLLGLDNRRVEAIWLLGMLIVLLMSLMLLWIFILWLYDGCPWWRLGLVLLKLMVILVLILMILKLWLCLLMSLILFEIFLIDFIDDGISILGFAAHISFSWNMGFTLVLKEWSFLEEAEESVIDVVIWGHYFIFIDNG